MLNLYADILGLNPYTFFGVNHTDSIYRANAVWTKEERQKVLIAMQTSRARLEQALGYFILPTYKEKESHLHISNVIRLLHPHIIAVGERQITTLDNAIIDYDTEPAVIRIVTDLTHIHIYHPVTKQEILIESSSNAEGVLILSVPRYRLVLDENNPAEGWDYNDLNNFLTEVEVKDDLMTGVQDGHQLTIVNAKMGLIRITEVICQEQLLIDYLTGLSELDTHLKTVWVNFAHAEMPIQPNEDSVVKIAWLWARDIPKQLSDRQKECLFGQHTGAYQAWQYATLHRLFRARPL